MSTPHTDPHSEEEIQFTTAPPSHTPGSGFWPPTSISEEKMEGIEDEDGDEPFTMPRSQIQMIPNKTEPYPLHQKLQRNPEMPQQVLQAPTAVMLKTMRSWKTQMMNPLVFQNPSLTLPKLTSLLLLIALEETTLASFKTFRKTKDMKQAPHIQP
jgi:hypothetical protein